MCTVLLSGIYLARESLTRYPGIVFIWLRRLQNIISGKILSQGL